ncbi:MAG: efflux RND transporter periplasmic adaptor subunit [Candidatus Electryonea clarkiae]|nr:efflux RND transporter periplasmic adaptor subunit [Candidatus Electryonea clarkiae]MDP8287365.1 efflux RND transporter periplasmic adaptor subunit [Candidatus Electryonea clarkiae]
MSKGNNKKKIWIIIAAVVLIGGLVTANILVKRKPKGKEVDTTEVKLDSLIQAVTASGKIQPEVDVNISAEVSGRILYLGAEEGHHVRSGQMLVQIEDEYYLSALQQMEFGLTSAEASLDEVKSRLKRTIELHGSNLASDAELEANEAIVKRMNADVDRARANVAQAEDRLSKTKIFSPINGVVTRLNNEVGEMAIGASFNEVVIMVVSQLNKMEVNVEVNENDVVLLEISDRVKIEVFAMPDTSFRGMVTEIAHSGIVRGFGTSEEVTNFEVKVAVNDYVPQLRPGMSATVEIETERRDNTLIVPQESVVVRSLEEEKKKEERARKSKKKSKKEDKKESKRKSHSDDKDELVEVVYVIENDTAWVRPVKLGIYSDTHFEIVEGLSENDIIVTGPFRVLAKELNSGQRVEYDSYEEDDEENGEKEEGSTEEKSVEEVESTDSDGQESGESE